LQKDRDQILQNFADYRRKLCEENHAETKALIGQIEWYLQEDLGIPQAMVRPGENKGRALEGGAGYNA
jgi:hypothetical protein